MSSDVNTFLFSRQSSAKGRNGYFCLDRITGVILDHALQNIHLDFCGTRTPGVVGPIRLLLTVEDLEILHTAIEFYIKEAKRK